MTNESDYFGDGDVETGETLHASPKGFHNGFNQELLGHLVFALQEVNLYFTDEVQDAKGQAIKEAFDGLLAEEGWKKEVDDFGFKAYKSIPWEDGEIRVTCVYTKRRNLRVDVRHWGPRGNGNRWQR